MEPEVKSRSAIELYPVESSTEKISRENDLLNQSNAEDQQTENVTNETINNQDLGTPETAPETAGISDKKPKNYKKISALVSLTLGVLGVASAGIAAGWLVWYKLDQSLPEVSDISKFSRDETMTIKAANGNILQQTGPATREKVKLSDIPQNLVDAFVTSEDRRFYEHRGVDYQGILRAMASNIMARDLVEGGSTITQQLARIVFLNQEHSMVRKIREALMAQKIEREVEKKEILERYLNLVYLGSGAYGVADAAWVYFSKPLKDLDLGEMATLAGLPPAPSEYSPLVNVEAAKQRRDVVLREMQDAGIITVSQADQAIAEPIKVKARPPKRLQVEAPYFSNYVIKELPKYISKDAIEDGGLTIETTVDLKLQKIAETVVKNAVEIDGNNQNFDQASLVSMDPTTGEVKALVGGYNYKESEFNRAIQAQRQPGSTFKGLVYAAAIAAGFSPYDSYENLPVIYDGYQPQNYGKSYGGYRSMLDAIRTSVNVVAVKVLIDVGFEPTIKLAHDMGIKSKLLPAYSLALGSSEVNLLEMTNAYGTLAANGNFIEAHGIKKVIDRRGKVIYEAKFKPKRVLDKDSAAITTWMLEDVVRNGTGTSAYLSGRPVAGKTGTSEEYRDLWFMGYTPQLVTGVWLGNDNNKPTWGTSETAAFNWHEFMSRATEGMPVKEFPAVPEFYDRKPSIKAKPVEPKRIIYGMIKDEDGYILPYEPDREKQQEQVAPAEEHPYTDESN